jgi:hypothetical protein
MLQNKILYRFGQDNRFHRVLQPKQVPTILQKSHSEVWWRTFFFKHHDETYP